MTKQQKKRARMKRLKAEKQREEKGDEDLDGAGGMMGTGVGVGSGVVPGAAAATAAAAAPGAGSGSGVGGFLGISGWGDEKSATDCSIKTTQSKSNMATGVMSGSGSSSSSSNSNSNSNMAVVPAKTLVPLSVCSPSSTGHVTVGLATIESLEMSLEILRKNAWQGAEAGPFDPAIIRLLAQQYRVGSRCEEAKFQTEEPYNEHVTGSDDAGTHASPAFVLGACASNRRIALAAGLMNHAALWESIAIIIPALVPPSASTGAGALSGGGGGGGAGKQVEDRAESRDMIEFTRNLLTSILLELLDGGDCQHFVVCCELLFNGGMLVIPALPAKENDGEASIDGAGYAPVLTPQHQEETEVGGGGSSKGSLTDEESHFPLVLTAINDTRKREAYLAYLNLLTQLRLFAQANALVSDSDDPYLTAMSRHGVSVHHACSKCGKEVETGSVCTKCVRNVALCSLCHEPVRGLHNWCPVCSHGSHLKCAELWFETHSECAAGCGHQCRYHMQPSSSNTMCMPVTERPVPE
jgi:hypothetical protein